MNSHAAVWGPEAPTPAQLKEFMSQIESGRVTKDSLQAFLRGEVPVASLGNPEAQLANFLATVDYSQSLEEMIVAGKYDWRSEDVTTDHFSVVGRGKAEVELTLVHFNRAMNTDDVLREFKESGLRPGKIEELLVLGAKHPDLQREFPIVELGSIWRDPHGYRRCACLWRGGSERNLGLRWLGDGWSEDYRFLAVRES